MGREWEGEEEGQSFTERGGVLEDREWEIFLKYILLKYLFIWLCQVIVAACGVFSCHTWNLVPSSGTKPGPSAFGAWNPSHRTARQTQGVGNFKEKVVPPESQWIVFFFFFFEHLLCAGHWAKQFMIIISFCHLNSQRVQQCKSPQIPQCKKSPFLR